MFDTINVKVDRPLNADLVDLIAAEKGAFRRDDWFFKSSPSLDHNNTFINKLFVTHEKTGIILQGHNNVVELTQASLPRVLFGTNGKLIRSPEQLAEAQKRLNSILDEVTTARRPLTEYVRVDLVLHFRCDIQKFIAAHRHCRHPLIRIETDEYGPQGLKLNGSKVAICFYDKQNEMRQGPGNILRVEIQLRKPKLGELFGKEDKPLYHIDFWNSYRLYRRLICELKPAPVAETITLNSLLAYCEAADFRLPNGLTALENYRATVSHGTFLARRRDIKGQIIAAAGIDWSSLLPPNSLPEDLPDIDSCLHQ